MPLLVGDPARGLGAEEYRRPALGLAGEDAVTRGQVLVELLVGQVARRLLAQPCIADTVHGEAAQGVALVVPRVQVPVVAIVGDALRRHRAARTLVGGARAVFELQLLAFQHGRGDGAEAGLVQLAAAVRDDAHPVDRPLRHAGVVGQQALDPLLQRCQRARQHATARAHQQLLRGQQRVEFFRTQPQAGQFETLALRGVIAEAGLAIALDGRHQRIAQIGQVAVDRRARTAQLLLQPLHRDRITGSLQDAVQGGDAFDLVHGRHGRGRVRIIAEAWPFSSPACRWKRYRGRCADGAWGPCGARRHGVSTPLRRPQRTDPRRLLRCHHLNASSPDGPP